MLIFKIHIWSSFLTSNGMNYMYSIPMYYNTNRLAFSVIKSQIPIMSVEWWPKDVSVFSAEELV